MRNGKILLGVLGVCLLLLAAFVLYGSWMKEQERQDRLYGNRLLETRNWLSKAALLASVIEHDTSVPIPTERKRFIEYLSLDGPPDRGTEYSRKDLDIRSHGLKDGWDNDVELVVSHDKVIGLRFSPPLDGRTARQYLIKGYVKGPETIMIPE